MTLAGKLIGSTRNLQNSLNGGNNTTTSKNFIYGNGLEKIGDANAITSSHGDVKKLLNTAGSLIAEYAYDAFGNILSTVATINPTAGSFINDILYASEQYDYITETYYLRARIYSPSLGRFLEEDTYLGDGRNLYTYVGNNPLRYIDPSGYCRDLNRIGEGAFKIVKGGMLTYSGLTALIVVAEVLSGPVGWVTLVITAEVGVAGALCVAYGVSDYLEGSQDVVKGLIGDGSASINVVRDYVIGGNQDIYNFMEMMTFSGVAGGLSALDIALMLEQGAKQMPGPGTYTGYESGDDVRYSISDARILRRNMLEAGQIEPQYRNAAHHIVAGEAEKANEARSILYKFGIDINAAENGVFLPIEKGVSNASYHPSLHTSEYYSKVNTLLRGAQSKQEVLWTLEYIRNELLNDSF